MASTASDGDADPGAASAPAAPAAPIDGQDYTDQNNVPSLFEAMMAGVMYHRPKEPIPFLRQCLEKIYDGGDHPRPAAGGENGEKIEYPWNLFVGDKKRRKQKPPSAPGSAGALGPTKSVLPPIGGVGGITGTAGDTAPSRAMSPEEDRSPLSPLLSPSTGVEVMRFHAFEGADVVPKIKPAAAALALASTPIAEVVAPPPVHPPVHRPASATIDNHDEFTPVYAPDEPTTPVSAVSAVSAVPATEAPAPAANPTADEVAMGAVVGATAAAPTEQAEVEVEVEVEVPCQDDAADGTAEPVSGLADVDVDGGELGKDKPVAVGETEEDAAKPSAALDKDGTDGNGKSDASEVAAAGPAEAAAGGPSEAGEPLAAAQPELR